MATRDLEVLVKVRDLITAPLQRIAGNVRGFASGVAGFFGRAVGAVFNLRNALLGIAGALPAIALARQFTRDADAISKARGQLTALLGDARAAAGAVEFLRGTIAQLPIPLGEAFDAFTQLVAVGVEGPQRVIEVLARTAAFFDTDLNAAVTAFLSGSSRGLRALGIDMVKLSESVVLTSGQIRVETGKSAQSIRAGIVDVLEKRIPQATARATDRIPEAFQRLRNAISVVGGDIGKSWEASVIGMLDRTANALFDNRDLIVGAFRAIPEVAAEVRAQVEAIVAGLQGAFSGANLDGIGVDLKAALVDAAAAGIAATVAFLKNTAGPALVFAIGSAFRLLPGAIIAAFQLLPRAIGNLLFAMEFAVLSSLRGLGLKIGDSIKGAIGDALNSTIEVVNKFVRAANFAFTPFGDQVIPEIESVFETAEERASTFSARLIAQNNDLWARYKTQVEESVVGLGDLFAEDFAPAIDDITAAFDGMLLEITEGGGTVTAELAALKAELADVADAAQLPSLIERIRAALDRSITSTRAVRRVMEELGKIPLPFAGQAPLIEDAAKATSKLKEGLELLAATVRGVGRAAVSGGLPALRSALDGLKISLDGLASTPATRTLAAVQRELTGVVAGIAALDPGRATQRVAELEGTFRSFADSLRLLDAGPAQAQVNALTASIDALLKLSDETAGVKNLKESLDGVTNALAGLGAGSVKSALPGLQTALEALKGTIEDMAAGPARSNLEQLRATLTTMLTELQRLDAGEATQQVDEMSGALEKLADELRTLDAGPARAEIDQLEAALRRLLTTAEQPADFTRGFTEGLRDGKRELFAFEEDVKQTSASLVSTWRTVFVDEFATNIQQAIKGSQSFGDAWRNIAQSVIDSIQAIILKLIALKAVSFLLGGLSFGASVAGGSGSPAVNPADPTNFAKGGIVSGPQLIMAGDNPSGHEALVPLPDGRSIPVRITSGGTGISMAKLLGSLEDLHTSLGELARVAMARPVQVSVRAPVVAAERALVSLQSAPTFVRERAASAAAVPAAVRAAVPVAAQRRAAETFAESATPEQFNISFTIVSADPRGAADLIMQQKERILGIVEEARQRRPRFRREMGER